MCQLWALHVVTKRQFFYIYVGRGRRVMHDGMQYDSIQGKGQGGEPLKVGNSATFKGYLLPHLQWGLAKDHGFLNKGTIPKGIWAGFLFLS